MKLNNHSVPFPRHNLMILTLIISLIAFPAVSMLSILNNKNKDFIQLHDEKNTGDQEKLEENSKNEKKELPITHLPFENFAGTKATKNYRLQSLKRDFILEIPIPPPDFV